MTKAIYVAGPLFSVAERAFLEHLVATLSKASGLDPVSDFFLPHRDSAELGQTTTRKSIFDLDMRNLEPAQVVIAFLDGQDVDSGTCIELGYAYAKGKKILGIITDFRALYHADIGPERPNLMVWGVCEQGNTLFYDLDALAAAFKQLINEPINQQGHSDRGH